MGPKDFPGLLKRDLRKRWLIMRVKTWWRGHFLGGYIGRRDSVDTLSIVKNSKIPPDLHRVLTTQTFHKILARLGNHQAWLSFNPLTKKLPGCLRFHLCLLWQGETSPCQLAHAFVLRECRGLCDMCPISRSDPSKRVSRDPQLSMRSGCSVIFLTQLSYVGCLMLPYILDPYIRFRVRHQVASRAATGFWSIKVSVRISPAMLCRQCLSWCSKCGLVSKGSSDMGFGLVDVIPTIFMFSVFFETIYEIGCPTVFLLTFFLVLGCPTVLGDCSCYKSLTWDLTGFALGT